MAIHEKLKNIQTEIKAPKNLYNSFGKYKYRNVEGICEAVKSFLEKEKCSLTLTDDVRQIGDRIYVEATAILTDIETNDSVMTCAYAREPIEKKGMDTAQVTGTASSYARKYALNGLFLLDDTKDTDTDEYHKRTSGDNSDKKAVTESEYKEIMSMIQQVGCSESKLKEHYKVNSLIEITKPQYDALKTKLQNTLAQQKES